MKTERAEARKRILNEIAALAEEEDDLETRLRVSKLVERLEKLMKMKDPRDKEFRSKADLFAYDNRSRGAGKGDRSRTTAGSTFRDEIDRIFKKVSDGSEKEG